MMIHRSSRALPLVFGLLTLSLGAADPARALGLGGLGMSAAYFSPNLATPYANASFEPPSFVVGPGQETTGDVDGATILNVDFGDDVLDILIESSLTNPTWISSEFNGIVFTSLVPHGILTATVDGATTMAGLDDSDITFDDDQIFVNWGGHSSADGTFVRIRFAFVPEPGPATMIGLGLAGLLVARRRSGCTLSVTR